jgi:hypothetical protein
VTACVRCPESCGAEAARLRGVLVRITEALEDGAIAEAAAYALAGAEAPVVHRFVCINCGNAYEWPGELDTHRRLSSCRQLPRKAAA